MTEERNWPETPEPKPSETPNQDIEVPPGDTSLEALGDAYDPPDEEA